MAITVVKTPQGHIAGTTASTAAVSSSTGTALFTDVAHGLTTGNFVYIKSPYEAYNGYWYVQRIDDDNFFIREYATADYVEYVSGSSVAYYQTRTDHGWNCVHLPIEYILKSDSWPINGVDTARTITTFTNWNGYTYLVLNGDLKSSGTASTLESVILSGVTGVGGATITGVYRIIQWFSETNIVIDLEYDAGNVLSAGTCQYYYLNYHARVKIYGGLVSGHYWDDVKPYVEIAEIRVPFDSSGLAKLDVSEYVKSQIEVFSNNLQLDTLPNNIDAFCRVKISVAESYDDSDGYIIEEYVSSYTEDTTEIYAVNARQPFKTQSSGTLDDYVGGASPWGAYQKFLTPFTQPTLFDGKYFDLSFINRDAGDVIKIDRYSYSDGNYTLISSAQTVITDMDAGIYRWPIERTGSEDRIDVSIFNISAFQLSDVLTIDVDDSCSPYDTTGFYLTWLNYLGGYDYWFFKAQSQYFVDVTESKTQEINIHNNWPKSYGEFAQSITKQSSRKSKNMVRLNSQYLTKDQSDAISWIVSSPLVQILTSETVNEVDIITQRTVIVDSSTLKKYQDRENLYSISFTITYTDELPVQSS
jgi:hypothetical protein